MRYVPEVYSRRTTDQKHHDALGVLLLGDHFEETLEARDRVYEAINTMYALGKKSGEMRIYYTSDDMEGLYLYYVSQQYKSVKNMFRFQPLERFDHAELYYNKQEQRVCLDIFMVPDYRYETEPRRYPDVYFLNQLTPEAQVLQDKPGFQ